MTAITRDIHDQWATISPLLAVRNEQEYDLAVERLNGLPDEISTNEQHPLSTLLDTPGTVFRAYEEKHYPMPACSGASMLGFLNG